MTGRDVTVATHGYPTNIRKYKRHIRKYKIIPILTKRKREVKENFRITIEIERKGKKNAVKRTLESTTPIPLSIERTRTTGEPRHRGLRSVAMKDVCSAEWWCMYMTQGSMRGN